MGSNQSAPPAPAQPKDATIPIDNMTDTTKDTSASKKSKRQAPPPEQDLSGIDLVNYKCRKKKSAYKKCVANFYNEKFLQGRALSQEEECGDLFERYRTCYLKGLKREFFDKGKKKPKEGSILGVEFEK
jgi:hypothetical protein